MEISYYKPLIETIKNAKKLKKVTLFHDISKRTKIIKKLLKKKGFVEDGYVSSETVT